MNEPAQDQLFEADDRLSHVLRHVYCIQHAAHAAPVARQLMPNYEMLLVFNFGPPVAASVGEVDYLVQQTAVIGPLHTLLRYTVPPGADLLVVVFAINGFHRLLGKSVQELKPAGKDLVAPDLLQREKIFEGVWEELAVLRSATERVEFLNEYVLLATTPPDDDTRAMLSGITHVNNLAIDPVRAIAQARHLSPRSVQSQFQTNLGFSAKALARFLRFKKVVACLTATPQATPDWSELAFAHGYFDQSHLIKDFRQFAGMSPRKFVKQLASGTVCISQPGKHY